MKHTILAVAMGSFVTLTIGNLKLGNRSFQFNGAINLCEAGVEYALYAMNNSKWTSPNWQDYSGGDHKMLEVYGINLGQGMTGSFVASCPSPIYRITAIARGIRQTDEASEVILQSFFSLGN